MQDVDALLAELRAAGGVDSEGHFSLDAAAAREKLARFRLPHPAMWPLPFVSAAMWANATRLTFNERGGVWTVEWDAPTAVDKLPGLLGAATVPLEVQALRTALEMVVVLRPERVTISSEGRQCELRGGEAGPVRNVGHLAGTRIVIEPGELWRRLRGFIFESVDRVNEASVLRTAAEHAAIDIFVNSIPVNVCRIDLSRSLAAFQIEPSQPLPASALRFVAPPRLKQATASGPLRALVWIPDQPLYPPSFTIVLGGLSFAVDPAVLGLRRISCVVAAPHLEKDLSQSRLLLDDAYQAVVEEVSRHARTLLESLAHEAISERDGFLLVDLWQSIGEHALSSIDAQTLWVRIATVGHDIVKRGQYEVAAQVVERLARNVAPGRLHEAERAAGEITEALTTVMLGPEAPSDMACLGHVVAFTRDIRVRLGSVETERGPTLMARQRRAERRAIAVLGLQGRAALAQTIGEDEPLLDNVRALCERLQGDLDAAEQRLTLAAERSPRSETAAQSTMFLAEISRARGHLPLAIVRYRAAVSLLDERSPAVRIPLLEGWAETLHAAGDLREAIRTLEMAIDLRLATRVNEEHELTMCAFLWRQYHLEDGRTFAEMSKVGRWLHRFLMRNGLEGPTPNEALSLRPVWPPRLDEALRQSHSLPFAALEICTALAGDIIAADGLAAEGLERVSGLTAYLHRLTGKAKQADVHLARRHLVSLLRWTGAHFTIL